MRRFLSGSILASWIAFVISAAAHGVSPGGGGAGLLIEIRAVLTEPSFLGLSADVSGFLIVVIAAVTLALMLWALMFAACTGRDDFVERLFALTMAFAWVLSVTAISTALVLAVGLSGVLSDLFALHWATLVSMLAAGGVEFAWEGRLPASTRESHENALARRLTSYMATASARLAVRSHDQVNGETA